MKYLITNWKASINKTQAQKWLDSYLSQVDTNINDLSVIICPPFPLLEYVNEKTKNHSFIKTGSQTVSAFENGAYTGEVTAEALKDYASFSIIGHSERRKFLHLSEKDIETSLIQCKKHSITPVLCIRNQNDVLYDAQIVAYEPVEAIGSGHNADPEDVISLKKSLDLTGSISFLYGGSVNEENMTDYLKTGEIDGFLVGSASLDPQTFFAMTKVMLQQ